MDISALSSITDAIGRAAHNQAKTWQTASQSGVTMADPTGSAAAPAAGAITSNDFLTLLVSELKNQDPTAQTDPNAYIDQLVQVNSLQQLISINQELSRSASGGPKPAGQMATMSDVLHASTQASRVG